MYREDLDGLVKLFQRCASITISDSKNEYDSLDEMKETIGLKVVNLDIRGVNPGLHFLLNQKEYRPGSTTPAIFNELRTEETTDAADNLFRETKDFLSEHQRLSPLLFLIPAVTVLVGLGLTIVYAVVSKLQGQQVHIASAVLVCVILSLLAVFLGVVNRRNYLRLETKRNSASFLARNQEEFAKHAVTALISGLIGLFFGWLLGRVGK
jgi:hypothetical protein